MVEAFVGKYVLESRENFENFLRGIEIPETLFDQIKQGPVTAEFSKNGDVITVKRNRPGRDTENSFKLGEPIEIENMKGEKVMVTMKLENGKIVSKGENYSLVSEIVDGKLKESVTFKGHSMARIFAKQ